MKVSYEFSAFLQLFGNAARYPGASRTQELCGDGTGKVVRLTTAPSRRFA